MKIRTAQPADAAGISAMLTELTEAGKRTARSDLDFAMTNYIANPDGIRCAVAVDEQDSILGLQLLMFAVDGNRFETPIGWGIIGTHVSPRAARGGIGRRLFEATREAATEAALIDIEAFIATQNVEGQAYYEAIGFRTWRITGNTTCKRYRV